MPIDFRNLLTDPKIKTVFPNTPTGIKLRKAGLSPAIMGCQEDLNYLYQQLKLSLGLSVVESNIGE